MYNFDKIKEDCLSLWDEKNTEKQIVVASYKIKKDDKTIPLYDNFSTDVKGSIVSSKISKQGNFLESLLYIIMDNMPNITFLDGCVGHTKGTYKISIPKKLERNIQDICTKMRMNNNLLFDLDFLEKSLKRLYNMAKRAKRPSEQKEKELMVEFPQDLDLGFKDNNTGNVYIYEIKKGSIGAKGSKMEDISKYLRLYVNYVYHNEISFDKLFLNMVFMEEQKFLTDKEKGMPPGGRGYILFDEFIERHNIPLSAAEKKELFEIPIVKVIQINKIIKRVEILLDDHPNLLNYCSAPTDFYDAYCKAYPYLEGIQKKKKHRVRKAVG